MGVGESSTLREAFLLSWQLCRRWIEYVENPEVEFLPIVRCTFLDLSSYDISEPEVNGAGKKEDRLTDFLWSGEKHHATLIWKFHSCQIY